MNSLITRKRTKPDLRVTLQEADRAFKTWNATCGPNALAAALNLSLREVKEGVVDPFPGYMNPTQMAAALNYFGVESSVEKNLHTQELRNGIGYIQWDGPWVRDSYRLARYRHTHWIACRNGWVFDPDSLKFGWYTSKAWRNEVDAFAAREYSGWFFWQWYEF
jgi:hypothetical protein